MQAKYLNLFTDFGFKKIFGEEASKPLLLDFLNALLPIMTPIKTISFKSNKQLGKAADDRKNIFDIHCEDEAGDQFIVTLQKARQNYFKERTIYYATFPVKDQTEKGDWNYNLKAIYCISILDFTFDDHAGVPEKKQVVHEIKLKNQAGDVFYDKLTYLFLELPNFKKVEAELKGRLDKWLYFIKHLEDFQNIPQIFKEEIVFVAAFKKAELSKLDAKESASYDNSLKTYRDMKGVIDTARDEGKLEGILEVAKAMKENGVDMGFILKVTGLSEQEINKL